MASNPSYRKATGVRRASKYKPVQKQPVDHLHYPATSSSAIHALHDFGYYQGLLSNKENYSADSQLQVLEVIHGKVIETNLANEAVCKSYIEDIPNRPASFRLLFCGLEKADNTTFGSQLSLSLANTRSLLKGLQVCPQFINLLFGQPDYWSPGDFAQTYTNGDVSMLEFFCQQPRWKLHAKDLPWSTNMKYDSISKSTSYIVVCDTTYSLINDIRSRVLSAFASKAQNSANMSDPFMVHTLIVHEFFLEARSVITTLRGELYDQLDRVDIFSEKSIEQREKGELGDLTIKLHVISQELDSMTASADMTSMIVRQLRAAHTRYMSTVADSSLLNATTKTADSINYLAESVDSQKRWLLSYKARKDIAMNLVFNLVTQQDAVTSTTIAREAKADTASMKVITALTMVFLPGTFLAAVFGMSMLNNVKWWLYVALTLPLTVLLVSVWWVWFELPNVLHYLRGKRSHTVLSKASQV